MLLTEQEAAAKICHETLLPVGTLDGIYYDHQCCIASNCMAWRWHGYRQKDGTIDNDTRGERAGYCGKAGKP